QIHSHQIGGTVVLLEEVSGDDVGALVQAQFQDFVGAPLCEVLIEFNANRVGMELLRRDDHDTAVAGAQVEHLFAGLQTAELQHLFDNSLGGGVIRSEFLGVAALSAKQSR